MKYTENDALNIARIVFSGATKARKLNRGYSHELFEVETGAFPETVIVKFGKDVHEKFSLGKEVRVLKIVELLGIPVPRVIYYDNSKTKFLSEFVILSKAVGEDLDKVWKKFNKKEQEEITKQMGEVLGKMHTVKFDTFGMLMPQGIYESDKFSLKSVGEGPTVNPAMRELLLDAYCDLGKLSSHADIDAEFVANFAEYLSKNKKYAESYEEPALIHGDFDIINFKVKKIKGKWTITCLFDFEYAAAKARNYDFIKLHRLGFFEVPHLRKALLEGYSKYQKVDLEIDEKVAYLRNSRDIGYIDVLLRAGNIELANKLLQRLKKTIKKN
jgi:hypothetical protein